MICCAAISAAKTIFAGLQDQDLSEAASILKQGAVAARIAAAREKERAGQSFGAAGSALKKSLAEARRALLEKAGDIATLLSELGKGQKMFGLLPSFKEKAARFETAFREEPWKLELKIEANYRQLVGMLRRNKSLAYVGDLERFAAKYPDSLYGKWALLVAKEYRASSSVIEPQVDLASIKSASSTAAMSPRTPRPYRSTAKPTCPCRASSSASSASPSPKSRSASTTSRATFRSPTSCLWTKSSG